MGKAGVSKYRNKKTLVDNILFSSKKEAMRYLELKQWQKEGKIGNLTLQTKYLLEVNKIKICNYKADFCYFKRVGVDPEYGELSIYVVEDVKGMKTAVYRLKKKLMLACYGIEILET